GGSVRLYLNYIMLFSTIEKRFNCKIKKKNNFEFQTTFNNNKIQILFAKNPTRDNIYIKYKNYLEKNRIELLPPPGDEVAKKIKNSDVVLFFGLCGGFKGRKGDIYLPEKLLEISLNSHYLKKEYISHINAINQIKINNIFIGKINGKKSKIITSNVALCADSIEEEESLIELCRKLSDQGDIVDKESYSIAKNIKNIPLGIMVMSSDLLYNKKTMLRNKRPFIIDTKKFNKFCLKCIESVL
ncbi:hypothetical protein KKG29_05360, partial [Patescibacteria group bacterium]|nr:hypothetical protein [Patescibacteria group bacterium]